MSAAVANEAGLREERAALRRAYVSRVAFVPMATMQQKYAKEGKVIESMYALNLVVGVHFPPGARGFRDLNKEPRLLALKMANAFAHATGAKKGTARTAPKKARKRAAAAPRAGAGFVIAEAVEGDEDDEEDGDGAEDARPTTGRTGNERRGCSAIEFTYGQGDRDLVVEGIRLIFIFFAADVRPGVARAAATAAAAAAAAVVPPTPTDDGDDDEDDEDSRERPAAVAVPVVPAPPVRRRGTPDLLSLGILASCVEATQLQKKVQALAKKQHGAKRARRGNGPAPVAALRPEDTICWSWAELQSPAQFCLGPVQRYHQNVACSSLEDLALVPDRRRVVKERRTFHNADSSAIAWNDVRQRGLFPYDDMFALNKVFPWDAAMCYFAQDLAADQTDRRFYFDAAPLASQPADDADNIDGMALLNALAGNSQDVEAVWPPQSRKLEDYLRQPLEIRGTLMSHMRWPRIGTTYVLQQHSLLPEVLAQLTLPHAMGEALPYDVVFQGGHRMQPIQGILRNALVLQNLSVTEEERARRHQQQREEDPSDIFANFNMDVAKQLNVFPGEEGMARASRMVHQEQRVVDQALFALSAEACDGQYLPLLQPELEHATVSTASTMGTLDFVPGAHVQLRNRDPGWRGAVEVAFRARPDLTEAEHEDYARSMAAFIDELDADFVKRDDILAKRQQAQAARAIVRQNYRVQIKDIPMAQRLDPTILGPMSKALCAAVWEVSVTAMKETMDTLMNSQNLPEAVKCVRNWMIKNCRPAPAGESHEPEWARVPVHLAQRPMTMCLQEMGDIFCGLQYASPQAYVAGMVGYFAMLDAFTYAPIPGRSMPACSMLFAGKTGVGKSFVMQKLIGALTIPGVVYNLSTATTQSMNTDTSHDHYVLAYEEFKSAWLFAQGSDHDKGASNDINLLKQRMSGFFAQTPYTWTDDATGKRMTLTCKSSHQNVTMGGTNQFLSDMDKAVGRRFIVWFVPKQVGAGEGDEVFDRTALSTFVDSDRGRSILYRQHQVYAAYVTMSMALKAGVLDAAIMSGVEMELDAVLVQLHGNVKDHTMSDPTKRHFVLQLARNIQQYFACWQAVAGPLRDTVLPKEQRWTPEGMLTSIAPFLVPTKEALVAAMTMLEFLYTPIYVEHMLRIVTTECCHLDKAPQDWPFRTHRRVSDGQLDFDCNYVVIPGRDKKEICERLSRLNKEYELRKEDIEKFLSDLGEDWLHCDGLVPDVADPVAFAVLGVAPVALKRDESKPAELRKVLFFEEDSSSAASKNGRRGGHRLCILIKFLEERLHIKAGDAAAVQALRETRRTLEHDEIIQVAFLDAHTKLVPAKRSALAVSLERALSSCAFERDDQLDRLLRPNRPDMPFFTAYIPPPLTVYTESVRDAARANRDQRQTRTISCHGSHMMLPLARGTAPLVRENRTMLLPTAKRTFAQFSSTDGRDPTTHSARRYENAYGVVARERDPDSHFAEAWMRLICHPGLPAFDRLVLSPDVERPANFVLPYAYGPVLNDAYAALAETHGDDAHFVVYPRENIQARVEQAVQFAADTRTGTFGHRIINLEQFSADKYSFAGLSFIMEDADYVDAMDIDDAPVY